MAKNNQIPWDTHHIFHDRNIWTADHLIPLRNHPNMMIPMYRQTHTELHKNKLSLPYIRPIASLILYRNLPLFKGNNIAFLNETINCFEKVRNQRGLTNSDRILIDEITHKINYQIPYIKEGIFNSKTPPRGNLVSYNNSPFGKKTYRRLLANHLNDLII